MHAGSEAAVSVGLNYVGAAGSGSRRGAGGGADGGVGAEGKGVGVDGARPMLVWRPSWCAEGQQPSYYAANGNGTHSEKYSI